MRPALEPQGCVFLGPFCDYFRFVLFCVPSATASRFIFTRGPQETTDYGIQDCRNLPSEKSGYHTAATWHQESFQIASLLSFLWGSTALFFLIHSTEASQVCMYTKHHARLWMRQGEGRIS